MTQQDTTRAAEQATIGALVIPHMERGRWVAHAEITKFWGDDREKEPNPYEVADGGYNTLTTAGANYILGAIIAAPGTLFNNANAAIGVGDSSAAFALGQTNLQGAVVTTDRIRKGMNATYPSVATNVLTAQSTFATGEANFVWNEWACFTSVTDASGTMINRAVVNLGTKTSASAWTITITITLT
ncbi:MAG: hypothetical protein LC793_04490 [Thermomicrobia bacterium]|nr:hypothetical protein [Thermomicrobia bacterium]MCA1724652.1 hypothetical protein [Thermomicrobia bacterium]